MFTRSVTIFRLLGFEIKLDFTWIFIALLVTWELAVGYFPQRVPDQREWMYWALAIEGALGLFASIIVHELGHALVARHYGIPIRDITLFIFGGVASMDDEPKRARDEFYMAIAGPIMSGLVAVVMLLLDMATRSILPNAPVLAVFSYLAWMNALLAGFNMIPAFPLDGGRVLRAILWDWKKDPRQATRIAAALGSGLGFALILLGIFQFMNGLVFQGVWSFLIGMFVRNASAMSYQQMILRRALEGESVRRFMKSPVVSVQPNMLLQDFVNQVVYTHHHKLYPVMVGDLLRGSVTTRAVKAVPHEQWMDTSVGEVAEPCTPENCVSPDMDAMEALTLMNRTGRGRLLVVEEGALVGIVSLKDLMEFLGLKLDLEGPSA